MKFEKIYILDTNIILEDANQIFTIAENGKNLIILPETVIDELDSKKVGVHEINFQAREFGRILSDFDVIKNRRAGSKKDVTIMSLKREDIQIDIISYKNYFLDDVDINAKNDRKIIKVAQFAKTFYKIPDSTFLLSNDIMCRTRAISLNIQSQGLTGNNGNSKNEFVKKLEIQEELEELIENLQDSDITEIDQNYKPENFCYHFLSNSGNQKLGYIINKKVNIINKNHFDELLIEPLNKGQKFACAGMIDPKIDICIIDAIAGSGKTLLAIASGMYMIKNRHYDKIIYIRNSIESVDRAEEVGFLSGNDEKFKVFYHPLYDTMEFIAQKGLDKYEINQLSINNKVEELMIGYNIETLWPGAARGRTISNAYVIIDEVQNFAKSSLQTVLSRVDKDCKVICIGSNRQIDHPFVNKYTNGLSTLLKAIKEENPEIQLFGTELNKVVRGKITEFTERIFEKK